MAGDVALTSSVRTNLLSLQSTNALLEQTQSRLATGREVNSVFDDPINFVASQRLNDRANDLNRVLDGISNSLRTVEQANNGATAVTSLLDQAQSIIDSAQEALGGSASQATVTGNVDLSQINDLVTGLGNATATSRISINLVGSDGANIIDGTSNAEGQVNFADIIAGPGTGVSAQELVNRINDINAEIIATDINFTSDVIQASLNSEGQLEVQSLVDGSTLNVDFISQTGTPEDDAGNLSFANQLGFENVARLIDADNANGTNDVAFTVVTTPTLTSSVFFTDVDGVGAGAATTRLARASDSIVNLVNSSTSAVGNLVVDEAGAAADATGPEILIGVNGTFATTELSVDNGGAAANGTGTTIQDLIDTINNDANIGSLVAASFDDTTGQINIQAIDASVQNVQIGIRAEGGNDSSLRLGFGQQVLNTTGNDNVAAVENIQLGSAAGELIALEGQFDSLRTQIDQIVADSEFRGTNLLQGDSLTTFFNGNRSNTLTTAGSDLTSSGLGLTAASFGTQAALNSFTTARLAATDSVRAFQSALTGDLNIISTREDFTTDTINTLTAASDDLTLADEQEEGARLLALQTRQSLGITSLSLASQQQQSILRLF